MKIQNENPQATASTQTQRPSELTSARKQSSFSGRIDNSGEDRLEISSFADRVSAATEAHVTQRAERVKELTALYQSGRYEVDTSKLSQALVNSAITTNRPGE
jgi:anti-sigma28 factor (negative regulator of flagellin synthesis)